ncbi:response regulator transcription factor (plasmid) [Deinococcus taeanensis]|uniref:helix-turn-helix domain-containing protein n=1 Tax=Deinococcus taeanensis TaxID=2737050 RepID=UPI001CDBCF0E|nr:response regulator transcription factor [Deinococcus taeanensis]UBV44163.1 response regulator transcription factor [Deinococcus taeanensis]
MQLTPSPFSGIFTPRQLDILRNLALGYSNQEIGLQLNLSDKTVRNQLCAIYASLGVSNRVHAARWALRAGLVSLDPGVNERDVLDAAPDDPVRRARAAS